MSKGGVITGASSGIGKNVSLFLTKKGFTVYSVSLDKSMGGWTKAITKDKLEWPYHVSDLKFWSSAAGRQRRFGCCCVVFARRPDTGIARWQAVRLGLAGR